MRRLGTTLALALAACVLAPAAGEARTAPYRIQTIPAVKGVAFHLQGKVARTDAKGRVVLHPAGLRADEVKQHVSVSDCHLSATHIARPDRWYGRNILTLNNYYRMQLSFHDLAGSAVDPDLVTSITLKSRTGVRTVLTANKSVWLQGSRVVPFSGDLVSKDIDFQVERAFVDGTNVVNRAQQRFRPRTTR